MFAAIVSAPAAKRQPLREFTPPAARLRDRVAYGSYLDQAEIEAAGEVAWLDSILAMGANDAAASVRRSGVNWAPTGFDEVDWPSESEQFPKPQNVARVIGRKDGIRGMMAEFWLNHLVPGHQANTSLWFASMRALNEYYYQNALGNFPALLTRYLKSVPLQHFMTNYLNTAANRNENLGREYLELFALGIAEPNETPRYDPIVDVSNVADILTGHGVATGSIGQLIDGYPDFRIPRLANQSSGGGINYFYADDGTALAGGNVSFYEPGTLTPKAVYSNSGKTIAHTQPVTLDGDGKAAIYGTGLYRVIAKNASNVTQWDMVNPDDYDGTTYETFWFTPANHDGDAITVSYLPGITFSDAIDGSGTAGPNNHPSLTKLIYHTVRHRPSARFICTKMARWFLGIDPSPLVREAMIDTYLENIDADDQIAKTLRVLFLSSDFCSDYCKDRRSLTPMAWYSKLYSFFSTDISTLNLNTISDYMEDTEEYFTGIYQTPKGYVDIVDIWLSPGKMSGRAVRGNTVSSAGNPTGVNYATKHGLSTPRDYLNLVNTYIWGGRATTAELNALGTAFSNATNNGGANLPLDNAIANWGTTTVRDAQRRVMAAAILHPYAHLAV